MTVSLKLFITNPTNKHQYLLRSSCRLLLACITSALGATRGKHGISPECFSSSLASRFALVMYEMSCSPRLALKATVMQATFYTLNELFHSALPSEYDVCVLPTRLTNCVVTTLQTWIQRRFPQPEDTTCSHYYVHARAHSNPAMPYPTHPHVFLLLPDTTQPFPQYHLFFTNTFTFYLPSNVVLLCSNLYLSFSSEVLTSRISAIRGLPVSSRLML